MNETLKTIFEHRTIRCYKSDPIPKKDMEQILLAASRASTTGNMQVYSIIVTEERSKLDELYKLHFSQQMVLEAPVLLTFCADFNRFNAWCRLHDTNPVYDNFISFFTASIDALLAAQNAVIAAESLGLGICYLGTTTYQAGKLIDFFNLPDGVIPVTTLVIGYPNENPPLTDRLPLEGIVHYETYNSWTKEKIMEVYAEKEALPLTKKLLKENNLDNLAKIFVEKRYTAKDNLYFSNLFLQTIDKHGFMNNE